jgi:hypothetical protein
MHQELGEGTCQNCFDWDITKVQFKRPSKMPKDIPSHYYSTEGYTDDIMTAKKISFESIKEALQCIHEKTYRKEWTDFSNTVQSFASFECINTQLGKKVYDAAKELRKKHIREEGGIRDNTQFCNTLLPPAFSCHDLSMDRCMVGIMHTYFLNGGKKFLGLIHDVFKKEKMGTIFLTKSKLFFRDVRNLSLSWIMAWPFGSTADKPMAPWVSENFVAYYHVSKSHISILCERLILKGKKNVADSLKLLVSVWHRLLSIAMQPETPSPNDIVSVRELTKLFLSRYHHMEKYLQRKSKDWDLQNTSCHLMLLLLPEYMTKFGCLRNYWEGGHMGERSITKLKRSLPHGAHMDGSVRTAIRRYFIDVVLSQLMEKEHMTADFVCPVAKYLEGNRDVALDEEDSPYENPINNNENCTTHTYDRYRRFRVYTSLHTLRMAVVDRRPIAVVFLRRMNLFYAIIWDSVNKTRLRTMHKVEIECGNVIEGTFMISQESLLRSLGNDEPPVIDNVEQVIFDHGIAEEAIACAGLPYAVVGRNNLQQATTTYHYFIRTENHTELRTVINGIPVFSYSTLYSINDLNVGD